MTATTQNHNFMKTYIKLIITAALLLGGVTVAQADHHHKTNKVAHAKAKPAPQKADPREARKRYATAAKKIKEAVKAGKLTEAQAKEKYTALRKRMAGHTNSRTAGRRTDILKKFDKNKDGKLDDKEKAAARKATTEWRKKAAAKRPSAEGRKKGRRSGSDKGRRSRSEGGDRRKRPA